MKHNPSKLLSLLFAVPFVCMCSKENSNEPASKGEQITITATMSDTKVDLTQGQGELLLTWSEGDALMVIGNTAEKYDIVDDGSGIGTRTATFLGTSVEGEKFIVYYPGTYATVEALTARSYKGQVQTGNGNLGHLEYNSLARGLADFREVNFGADGVLNNGVLKLVVTLPEAVKEVSSISISAPEEIFYTTNGTEEKTATLTLDFENCEIDTDHILTAYMMTSWQDVTIKSGTKLTIDVTVPDRLCHYTKTMSKKEDIALNGGACLNIDISKAATLDHVLSGSGTEADPYLLYNAEDMAAVRDSLVADRITYFKMMENIDMKGINWVGGNQASPFTQHIDFDGCGHKIINLTCNNTGKYTGLVGVLSGRVANVTFEKPSVIASTHVGIVCSFAGTIGTKPAIIEKVTITGGSVTQNGTPNEKRHTGLVFGHSNVADCEFTDINIIDGELNQNGIGDSGFIGGAQNIAATFTNCHVSGTLTIKSDLAPADSFTIPAGGIQGYSVASTYNDCTFCGTINGGANCGGIVGYTPDSKAGAKILNCRVLEGSKIIATKHGDHCLAEKVGGIIGYSYAAEVSGCTNYAEITGSKSVGGIVGQQGESGKASDYTVKECKNYGKINGDSNATQFFGGIIGLAWHRTTTLQNCRNYGEVEASNATCVGGVTGYIQKGTVEDCHNYVAVTAKGTQGGIAGQVEQTVDFSGCTNSGEITAKIETKGQYAGGLVGLLKNGSITKCSNSGKISATGYYIGGIVGATQSGGSISNSYSKTDIETSNTVVGGIIGNIPKGSVSQCWFEGTIKSNDGSGGIAGWVNTSGSTEPVSISDCYTKGTINGLNQKYGGIFGTVFENVNVKNCYSTMNVSGGGRVYGGIGGLSTNNGWNATIDYDYKVYISNCISAGEINSSHTSVNLGSSGAVIGYTNIKYPHFTNCWRTSGYVFNCSYKGTADLVDQGYNVNEAYQEGTHAGGKGGTNWYPYHGSAATASALQAAYSGWTTSKTDAQITVSDIAAAINTADAEAFASDIWDLSGEHPTLKNNPEPAAE